MKTKLMFAAIASVGIACAAEKVISPDGRLAVEVGVNDGEAYYSVAYDGRDALVASRLGLVADFGDLATELGMDEPESFCYGIESYCLPTIKKSEVTVEYETITIGFTNATGRFEVEFFVSNNDVAFRYHVPRQDIIDGQGRRQRGERGCIRVMEEATEFAFPAGTTGFITPQSDAMISWKRSKPSYEEEYVLDAPLPAKSKYGKGWTFPALFREGSLWILVGETGTDANYCGCRLGEFDGTKTKIEFPQPEENNGNGTVEPAFALPGATPWRTITVGDTLAPIVETTIAWDVVQPKYEAKDYEYGRNSWSWIVWQDASMNWDGQVKFIDFAAAMGWEGILVDAGWDKARDIGYKRMPELVRYAASKGVGVWLWYSSSGWWNDIVQSPINVMSDPIARKRDMRWIRDMGVRGIKVDFWGGDKQETMRLYEQVLSDADDNGLMVIFHGCTIPRGWERMYPNYVGSEAVLASENRYFSKHFCDMAGVNAALHPFFRNALGAMEYGGTFLNERMSRDNKSRHTRGTTVGFELATAILFQNPVQNFALCPNNLEDAPKDAIDFMKNVPTTWDETRFLAGYPGKYCALARRNGRKWYIAAIAAEPIELSLDLGFCGLGTKKITLATNDGFVEIAE